MASQPPIPQEMSSNYYYPNENKGPVLSVPNSVRNRNNNSPRNMEIKKENLYSQNNDMIRDPSYENNMNGPGRIGPRGKRNQSPPNKIITPERQMTPLITKPPSLNQPPLNQPPNSSLPLTQPRHMNSMKMDPPLPNQMPPHTQPSPNYLSPQISQPNKPMPMSKMDKMNGPMKDDFIKHDYNGNMNNIPNNNMNSMNNMNNMNGPPPPSQAPMKNSLNNMSNNNMSGPITPINSNLNNNNNMNRPPTPLGSNSGNINGSAAPMNMNNKQPPPPESNSSSQNFNSGNTLASLANIASAVDNRMDSLPEPLFNSNNNNSNGKLGKSKNPFLFFFNYYIIINMIY